MVNSKKTRKDRSKRKRKSSSSKKIKIDSIEGEPVSPPEIILLPWKKEDPQRPLVAYSSLHTTYLEYLEFQKRLNELSSRFSAMGITVSIVQSTMDSDKLTCLELFNELPFMGDESLIANECESGEEDEEKGPILGFMTELIHDDEDDPETIEEYRNLRIIRDEMDQLIGHEDFKDWVIDLYKKIRLDHDRQKRGIKNGPKMMLNCQFTGPSGSGKTIFARTLGSVLHKTGIVAKDTFVVATKNELVGEHIGSTAKRTTEMLEKAAGGIMFIDEAHSLIYTKDGETKANSFNEECLNILIQYMEDHRNDDKAVMIIFAGYKGPMKKLINYNPGMPSRVPFSFNFDPYTSSELYDIFSRCELKKAGATIEESLEPIIEQLFQKHPEMNGRDVRNLTERMALSRDARLGQISFKQRKELTDKQLVTVLERDFYKTLKDMKIDFEYQEQIDEDIENESSSQEKKKTDEESDDQPKTLGEMMAFLAKSQIETNKSIKEIMDTMQKIQMLQFLGSLNQQQRSNQRAQSDPLARLLGRLNNNGNSSNRNSNLVFNWPPSKPRPNPPNPDQDPDDQ